MTSKPTASLQVTMWRPGMCLTGSPTSSSGYTSTTPFHSQNFVPAVEIPHLAPNFLLSTAITCQKLFISNCLYQIATGNLPAMTTETLGFQTEAKQLLHLMIHSLYSNKEIFLRELISNASDAADKLRFESLKNPDLLESDSDLKIRVDIDEEAKTITVADNGIGMSREEIIDNLGTIAKSGTSQFMQNLTGDEKKDSQMIGQFGVGFYSAFIVAEKVVVESRRAGLAADKAVRWSCEGEADFTIEDIERAERGTKITLHLRESEAEFASQWRLSSIVKKYSDHIAVPVEMPKMKLPSEEGEEAESEEVSYETINSAAALWTRSRSEISDEEYKGFYQHISHDMAEPLAWSHNRVEGKLDYTSLLYIPSQAPFDLNNREGARGLKLYVQRTFIMDDAEQFLPLYLRFVKGIVDCNDLPLNVSRELLQSNATVDSIRSALVKRVLGNLDSMAKSEPGDFTKFLQQFGTTLKEGVGEDFANREKVAGLLRFNSTHQDSKGEDVSLQDYISRMKDGQEKIYYLLADNINSARNSAYLEAFRKNGIEVLLLCERLDEWMMSHLNEFDSKQFQDISKGELDETLFSQEDKKESEEEKAQSGEIAERLKGLLEGRVEDVRSTCRLTESPACLVYGEHDLGIQMRQILEAAGQSVPVSKPTLEINLSHPLLQRLGDTSDDEGAGELAALLYDQAVLSAGEQLENPTVFVQRLNKLLFSGEPA